MKKYIRILSLLMMFAVLASLFVGCDGMTKEDRASLNADSRIENIINSDEYKKLNDEEKKEKIRDELDELAEKGVIKSGTIKYDDKESLYSFEYENGTLGGVSFKEFGDEYNNGPTNSDNGGSTEQTSNVNNDSKQKKAIILHAFGDSDFRRGFYEQLESDWDGKGLETDIDYEVTVTDFKQLEQYDVVVFSMHGTTYQGTPVLCLEEKSSAATYKSYKEELSRHDVVTIHDSSSGEGSYWILPTFFSNCYSGNSLNSSIIFSESCCFFGEDEISKNPDYSFPNEILKVFSGAVIGYHNSVGAIYSREVMKHTIDRAFEGKKVETSLNLAKEKYGDDDGGVDNAAYPILAGKADTTLVKVAVQDFELPQKLVLTIGEYSELVPELTPKDASDYSIDWKVSDNSVLSLIPSANGTAILNPLKKGVVTITAELTSRENVIQKETTLRVASKGRDTVLVLDVSGSMSGAPMEEMKKAAIQFCDDLIAGEYNNRVGLVLYDSQVDSVDLTNDLDMLKGYINGLSAGSTTNMEGGLSRAIGMLNDQGAENSIKNIVIMADGLPNEGSTSYSGSMPTDPSYSMYTEDIAYANAVIDAAKEADYRSYNVYSLGFFHTIDPGTEYDFASTLMKNITNMDDGYHEVERVEDLQFQFADVQKDIRKGAKIVINIACPVDVTVSYNGETLSSESTTFNDNASFGSLQLLGNDKDIKVLSLNPGVDYDVKLNGNGTGTMNYSINFLDTDENVTDYRGFESVPISPTTKIDSNTNNSDVVKLNVDENGDGKVDQVWSANKNSTTKQEDQKKESKKPVQKKESLPTWVIVLIIVGAVLLILILVLCIVLAKNKKKAAQARPLPQKRPNPNPQPVRPPVAPVMPSYQKQGTIVFTSGEYKGARIMLKEGDEVIMGKDSKISSIVFSDASISRKHCSIRMVGGEFILNDYSTNGVYSSLTKTKLKLAGASYTLHYHEAITLSKTNNTFYCE